MLSPKEKEKLKLQLFYTLRKYMLKNSDYNMYDDAVLYWSYDTNQFLKRYRHNKSAIYNWVEIPHNVHLMSYLKAKLNLEDKEHLNEIGRQTDFGFVSDDLHKKFLEYVNETFNNFIKIIDKENETDSSTAKRLF